jgi:hypothetical protein
LDEVFLRLLLNVLGELGNVQDHWGKERLKNFDTPGNSTIFEDCTDNGLEDITENLWGSEWLKSQYIHPEIFSVAVLNEKLSIMILGRHTVGLLLLKFFSLPWLQVIWLFLIDDHFFVCPLPVIRQQNILLESEKTHELSQEVILGQHALSLMSIKWLEVLLSDELLVESLLDVVLLEHGKVDQVRVGDIVKHSISNHLQFLVVGPCLVSVAETTVGEGFQEQMLVVESVA